VIEKALRLSTDLITVSGRIGIVDIGSNTVRLVVYDVPERMPIPMFNEKAECRLVEGMSKTGKLSPSGVKKAINSLRRFVRLSVAMGVEKLDLVATAAVRDASDGPAFVQMINTEFGIDVCVLTGSEEAELSALGLVVGVPKADGIMGDLGGGSLDLVCLERGQCTSYGTMPLGHLRLQEMADGNIGKAHTIIADHFSKSEWLRQSKGKNLYLTGGIMRAIARIFIEQTNYPLHVVDNFTIRAEEALSLSRLMAGLSRSTLAKVSSLSPSRVKSVPYATEVLGSLIEIAQPSHVVFSGFGMREGQMLQHLPEEMRHQDPLIAGAETLAEKTGRFSLNGAEVANWVSPLFPSSGEEDRRRILAACLLSDIGWNEHPDYRAEHSFYRSLRLPFAGLSHADRVFIAATVFVRYNGDPNAKVVNEVRTLLEPELLAKVDGIGRAIRLAHTLSGSAPGLLSLTSLERTDTRLILHLPGYSRVFQSETVDRRFRGLCKSLGIRGSISRN
jgi:exopolyphosphatase / guanosine-5'-triphosphate,3'-diphosphate pyrophosphatase